LQNTNVLENERKFGVEQVKRILNSDISLLKDLCKRASLEPKRDRNGAVYFSKDDLQILKKLKDLHLHTMELQRKNRKAIEKLPKPVETNVSQEMVMQQNRLNWEATLNNLENNIVQRISTTLSEKMEGLDEVVVELIRAKTENETLRQRVNELNKEVFALKNELASYKPAMFGLYSKKDTDNFLF